LWGLFFIQRRWSGVEEKMDRASQSLHGAGQAQVWKARRDVAQKDKQQVAFKDAEPMINNKKKIV
jgi:hypothetical protein